MEEWKQYYRGLIMLLLGKKRLQEDWGLPWKCQCLLTYEFFLFSKICGLCLNKPSSGTKKIQRWRETVSFMCYCVPTLLCKIYDQWLFWMKEVKKCSNEESVTAKTGDKNTGAAVKKHNYN